MTNSLPNRPAFQPDGRTVRWWTRPLPVAAALGLLVLAGYLLTLARGLILGDPTEFTFVANLPAIAHPPGYAFITLTGWLVQHLVPVGDYPWRMHLLSALAGTTAVLAIYGTILQIGWSAPRRGESLVLPAALFSALLAATGANFWQHSIHTNPHIITATFLVGNLFLLTRWAILPDPYRWKWLWIFCFSAGLGVTHHPLTVFSFPAYALFILLVHTKILLDWRRLSAMFGFAAAGLLPLLYYPIRSSLIPVFGPSTMNTLDGFLAHFLARGLSESLPYYSLADQPLRQVVFGSILRLQMAWPFALPAIWGIRVLLRGELVPGFDRPAHMNGLDRKFGFLAGVAFLVNYGFVISLKQQDIMAYLLGPLLVVALLAGIGLLDVAGRLARRFGRRAAALVWVVALAAGPGWNLMANAPAISLRDFAEGDRYIEAVFTYFEGRGDGVVLLNNWEFMTPLWYTRFVAGEWPNPADVRPTFVSAAEPWLPSVFNALPGGPVYLNGYRPEIVGAGFRLRPRGSFYQVVEPGNATLPPELTPIVGEGRGISLLAYELPSRTVTAGDYVPLTLAMRVDEATAEYFAPVLQVGPLQFPFTTDSHLITPLWQPGEIIVERFDFALPHRLPGGEYPLSVRMENLSLGEDSGTTVDLGLLTVVEDPEPPAVDGLLANFRHRVGLRQAVAGRGLSWVAAPWEDPLRVQSGDVVTILLEWEALDFAEESYTIFVHLIDPADQLVSALDYTPLGGAMPTHLWFPKWLPGQRMTDPYRLEIPAGLPPGRYFIEVGLYEMTGGRRLHMHDREGNLIGDRYILGPIDVLP